MITTEDGHGTSIEQQIKAVNGEVEMYVSRMTWHNHQKALDDAVRSLKRFAEISSENIRLRNELDEIKALRQPLTGHHKNKAC